MAKKEKKIRCALCKSQYKGFCVLKRVSVSLNKSRHCDKFQHDQQKVKIKQVLPTTRLPFAQKELDKQTKKAELKQIREMSKQQQNPIKESRIYKPSGNEKFPLTGDLSRFTTTGTKNK
ncbi:MAG TPA: hypothetical protein VMV86_02245 [Methanosarcinales archaeon]|nr:hypothetical protein [Methanosarcinales archaeon]